MDFSLFGQSFTRKTGIVNLMEDFGDAYHSDKPVYMLGGGNPAQIPTMHEIFRQQMSRILENGDQFDRMDKAQRERIRELHESIHHHPDSEPLR